MCLVTQNISFFNAFNFSKKSLEKNCKKKKKID